jgi:hypothetical protein
METTMLISPIYILQHPNAATPSWIEHEDYMIIAEAML